MELSKDEYKYTCPQCGKRNSTGIIAWKEDKRRYFCSDCFCEFEISYSDKTITVFKLSEAGQEYIVGVIELDKKEGE